MVINPFDLPDRTYRIFFCLILIMDVFTLRIPDEDRLSDDELFRICSANKELRIERDEEGQLIIMSPAGSVSSNKNFILNSIFGVWVESHSQLG